ncbi:16S rRNA (guanine(527)-N(7))-methyltransferase RsmG [uncultured Roseobacter sp.]|uniref:16S rRNA (guanine(527)-N(7))-methyltransferase RsmG n=1 Tax=uncultured Roseobacter sp. TaxID=114847 RepID=UPI00261BD485|nr:16S rRNA (guanine(527)-N(7))-methyltransferase RsmG [uncultured Roseobacter sp.]
MTSDLNVSRETLNRLELFHGLLKKWNTKINLVSKSSISDAWERHINDSLQVYHHAGDEIVWSDIGSGGGLPGLVVAILAKEFHPDRHVTMVESDIRKSTFLRTVIRELDLKASVLVSRIEQTTPMSAEILSARALADLDQLLRYAEIHLTPSGRAFFFKGETWEKEVETARKSWSFDLVAHKSKTNPNAAILEVKDIHLV